MSVHAASASRPSPAGDLLRLAIPVVLIAGAVAATLWIDRSGAPSESASAMAASAADSGSR